MPNKRKDILQYLVLSVYSSVIGLFIWGIQVYRVYFTKDFYMKSKIIQLVVFKDKLLALTDNGDIFIEEEYSEVNGKEKKPSIIEKQKNLATTKTRWKAY